MRPRYVFLILISAVLVGFAFWWSTYSWAYVGFDPPGSYMPWHLQILESVVAGILAAVGLTCFVGMVTEIVRRWKRTPPRSE